MVDNKIKEENNNQNNSSLSSSSSNNNNNNNNNEVEKFQNLDLRTLPNISENNILEFLRKCYLRNFKVLETGPLYILINRFESIHHLFNKEVYNSYYLILDETKDIINSKFPSISSAALSIYLKLFNQSQKNQSLFFIGESGSGKTHSLNDFCSHFIYLSSICRKDRNKNFKIKPSNIENNDYELKLFDQATIILESFGHSQTLRNYNSSRHFKSVYFNLDERGYINNFQFRCFGLEFYRTSYQIDGESNFKLFYDVFDDIYFSEQAMNKYGIDNLTTFRYTSNRPRTYFQPGKSSYKQLSTAFDKFLGISKSLQNTYIYNILAAILYLGEIEIIQENHDNEYNLLISSESPFINHTNRVLKLLGISLESLTNLLTKKSIKVGESIIESNLDLQEAKIIRDSLSCHLYNSLFRWMLTKINTSLMTKLPLNLQPNEQIIESRNNIMCYFHDLMGFESIEKNHLEQLCINYGNERLIHHLHQNIFIFDKELLEKESIPIPNLTFPDNSNIVKTIDNRSNGIFLLCEEQMRLKNSTDQKLAQFLYSQHSSNKIFLASKTEQKNLEFIIKHYTTQVKYNIVGFMTKNRLEASSEIITFLKSSSIEFIREDLASYCEKASTTVSSRYSLTPQNFESLLNETEKSTITEVVESPQQTPEKRPGLVKSRSAAFRSDSEKNNVAGRGMTRVASMTNRNGSLKNQTKTFTQLAVSYFNEILSEARDGESTFFLCLKLNDNYDPTKFETQIVARQLRPYGILEILSFYKFTFPYRMNHITFVNRFLSIILIGKKNSLSNSEFLMLVSNYRSSSSSKIDNNNLENWKMLSQNLLKLLPDLGELDKDLQILRQNFNEIPTNSNNVQVVINGIYIGSNYVFMSPISYYYLTEAQQISLKLISLRIWQFYINKKFTNQQKVAGQKIGILMKKYMAKQKAKKMASQVATVAMTQVAVKKFLTAKRAREKSSIEVQSNETNGHNNKDNNNNIDKDKDKDNVDKIVEEKTEINNNNSTVFVNELIPETIPVISNENTIPITNDNVNNINSNVESSIEIKIENENVIESKVETEEVFIPNVSVDPPESPISQRQQAKIIEQESLIKLLQTENASLKNQVALLNSKLAEISRKNSLKISYSNSNSIPPSPATPSPPPTTNVTPKTGKRLLQTQSSSLDTFSVESVYGGELSKDLDLDNNLVYPPEYEVFVQRILKSLKEDISYLLIPTPFYKFGRTGSCHQTLLQLSPNFQTISWVPQNSLTKSRDVCVVNLRSVWRLVEGQSTPPFEAYKGLTHGTMPPQRSFSLIYGFRSLDLCALDDETYNKWFVGLRYILQLMNGEIQEAGYDRQYLRKKWNFLDKKKRGFLSRKEVIQLIAGMDIPFDKTSFTTAVMRSTIGHSLNNEITFSQFDSLVYQLRRRPDLEIIWNRILNGFDFNSPYQPLQIDQEFDSVQLQEVLGVTTVREFWKLSQGRDLSEADAKALIAEGMGEMHQEDFPVLSYNGFVNIMTHIKNDAYDPVLCLPYARDMNYPLQHYFISSSDGVDKEIPKKELKSNSLLEDNYRPNCYANALNNGCRALELRCYEACISPSSDTIDVFVGSRKVTTKVTFKETIIHIQRTAFVHTQFPLILMLEISCGIQQQKRISVMLRKVFGDNIFTPQEAKSKLLPSPNDLRNRVIIFLTHRKKDIDTAYKLSDKSTTPNVVNPLTSLDLKNRKNSIESINHGDKKRRESNASTVTTDSKLNVTTLSNNLTNWMNDLSDVDSDNSDNEFSVDKPLTTIRQNTKNSTILPTSRENQYHLVDPEITSIGIKGPDNNEDGAIDSSLMRLCHYSKGHRLSTHSLKQFIEKIDHNPEAEESMINFNMTKFCCIYMDSQTKSFGSYGGICSAWDCGVSMVSVCREYPSLGTKINYGKFRQNGSCGYVLKPEKYRFRPTTESQVSSSGLGSGTSMLSLSNSTLILHIISGQELPEGTSDQNVNSKSKEKGYSVVIDLNGASIGHDDIQVKTLYIRKHGRNPFWNELFTFAIQDSWRGQLTLRVFHNEECVCFSSIPLSCLRVGFRSITLFEENEDNNYHIELLPLSKLFVRIGLTSESDHQQQQHQQEQQEEYQQNYFGQQYQNQQQQLNSTPNSTSKTLSRSLTAGSDRSTDSNSRMVGMDVSPGTKNWDRHLNRKYSGEDTIADQEEQSTNFKLQSPHRRHLSEKYARRSNSNGDNHNSSSHHSPSTSFSTPTTTPTDGHRSRDRRKSSRSNERIKRDRSTSRSHSVDR